MRVALHSRTPSEDSAQELLFSSKDAGKTVFPGGHFRSEAAVARRLASLDARAHEPTAIQAFLRHENAFAPLAPEQEKNLAAAGSKQAVFLLTGQQPGLLGGPALWYYKALSCATLAREWSARLDRPVIPIFWAAGDDADLEEINQIELLDARPRSVPGSLSLAFPEPRRLLPVGARQIPADELERLLVKLSRVWRPEIIAAIRSHYTLPATLTQGFLRTAQSLLGREGVLFVDGYSSALRKLARPTLLTAARRWEAFQQGLEKGTAALESAGVTPQVNLRSGLIHAFLLRDSERQRLFALHEDGSDFFYTADRPSHNLFSGLETMELTHDVFTRPLVAEAIFPVLGHILGPAELRYFGQMAPVFLESTGDMPLVHPRMNATVAPATAVDLFKREGWEYSALASLRPSTVRAHLAEKIWREHPAASRLSPEPMQKWLQTLRSVHGEYFQDVGPFQRFEKTLDVAWTRYMRALEREAYSEKTGKSLNGVSGGDSLFDILVWIGNGMGQARHINIHSLMNALGEDGFASLRAAADPGSPDHQLFVFDGGARGAAEGKESI